MNGFALDPILLDRYHRRLGRLESVRINGKVDQIVGLVIESTGPTVTLGSICLISRIGNEPPLRAEVVGFRGHRVLLMPLGEMAGVGPESEVVQDFRPLTVKVGPQMLGRVLNAQGEPIDDGAPLKVEGEYPLMSRPLNPLRRPRIGQALVTGVKAIDACLTCGKGQRMGIFSGSGVGKSILLGMIARHTEAEVSVIGLIGERGREVKDFIERDLGEEGLKRSVVVAVTSDQPAILRVKGAMVASAIAEYFRDQGADVILMMDSVTRFAMAQREIGLAVGEPPTTKGYPPSAFALLPKLLERAGTSEKGSITGIYTVLVESDDFNEPISDAVRSILDGHIVLSRDIASKGHYPAIDVLNSVSRVMVDVVHNGHKETAVRLREVLATYRSAEDLINIGAYVEGSNPKIDYARSKIDAVNRFLRQEMEQKVGFAETIGLFKQIFAN